MKFLQRAKDGGPCETHQWEPIPEQFNRYVCIACCATGYRSKFHDAIVPHKKQHAKPRAPVTARPYLPGGGRIRPKPRTR